MTTAGTTGVVIKDMTADGVENDAVRNFSPGAQIIGGHINGGLTGIDAEAATTITGTGVSLSNEGIRARTTEPVTVDNVTVDAVTVGMNVAVGTPIALTNSRVHALEAVRGNLGPQAAGNDLSLPAINLLGAIGIPLIILALVLEAHALDPSAPLRRHEPAPAADPAGDRVRDRNTMNPTRTLTARAAVLLAAVGLLLTGCGTKTPDALVRREVAAGRDVGRHQALHPRGGPVHGAGRAGSGRPGRDLRRGGRQDRPQRRPERHPARAGREAEQAGPAQGDRSRRVDAQQDHRDQPGCVAQDRGADGPLAQAARRRHRVRLGQGARRRHSTSAAPASPRGTRARARSTRTTSTAAASCWPATAHR